MAHKGEESEEHFESALIHREDAAGNSSGAEELTITRTADGIVISARFHSGDVKQILLQIIHRLSLLDEAGGTVFDSGNTMKFDSEQVPEQVPEEAVESCQGAIEEGEILDGDNLIPVAPPRHGGRIQVRLKRSGRDKPLPAENPWAE